MKPISAVVTPGLYRAATAALAPAIRLYLWRRMRAGREDSARFSERLGHPGKPRPDGPLIWLHAASVGEALSLLPLLDAILARDPACQALFTTGTVSSARLLAQRLPPRARHQYLPVDRMPFIRRFLDHWRPDLGLWAEAEFWPNMIAEARRRSLPLVIVNGRISPAARRDWERLPRLIRPMLASFALCLAQSEAQAAIFDALGAARTACVGNLKYAAPALPADPGALSALEKAIGSRPVWLAASTHDGEEIAAAAAHRALARRFPGLLTIIVPRHPTRGATIARILRKDFRVARRGSGDALSAETQIYLADTMGELGLFYRLVETVFIGGSLATHGGQNPLEPALLDCALLHGPDMSNFPEIAAAFAEEGAAIGIDGADALGDAVGALMSDARLRRDMAAKARAIAMGKATVLDAVMAEIAPFLAPLERESRHHARA